MSLRNRLVLVFAAFLALVVVGTGLIVGLTVRRDASLTREKRVVVAAERVARLETAYVNQESGERGYAITASEPFLEPYEQGRHDAARLTAALDRTISGSAAATLRSVTKTARLWRREAAEPEIAARRVGRAEEAAALITSSTGKARFDALRAALARLNVRIDRAARDAANSTDRLRRALNLAVAGVLLVALTSTVAAAVLVHSWITHPVDAIATAVRRVRAGALDRPIPAPGPPELAGLGRDADEMRLRLARLVNEADRARESVEQNASVVLTLQAQLEREIPELVGGWSVAAELRPAEGFVAGDCYDVVRLKSGSIALVVVDIAGHGAIAGILALRCRELLRASLALGVDPGRALLEMSEQLGQLDDETFLTAFVVVADVETGALRYANAGHPPALLCSPARTRELGPTGPIVGPFPATWATLDEAIDAGENLAVYTDGLIEVRREGGEMFGPQRLVELVENSRCEEADAVVKRCLDEVEAFAPGRLHDDATVVVLCRP